MVEQRLDEIYRLKQKYGGIDSGNPRTSRR